MSDRDDFEFKPLTEGLGFHKKVIDLKGEQHSILSAPLVSTSDIMPKSKNNPTTPISTPAPAPKKIPVGAPQPKGWRPSLSGVEILDKDKRPDITAVSTSFPAVIFDSAMVLGMALIFSTVVFATTGIQFDDLLFMLQTEYGAQVASVVLLFGVLEIYMVTCRTFFGKTLGEWAFDYRLGAPHEQQYLSYPFKVAWRTLLVFITGFITLPLLSLIVGRDIAGALSGVSIYQVNR